MLYLKKKLILFGIVTSLLSFIFIFAQNCARVQFQNANLDKINSLTCPSAQARIIGTPDLKSAILVGTDIKFDYEIYGDTTLGLWDRKVDEVVWSFSDGVNQRQNTANVNWNTAGSRNADLLIKVTFKSKIPAPIPTINDANSTTSLNLSSNSKTISSTNTNSTSGTKVSTNSTSTSTSTSTLKIIDVSPTQTPLVQAPQECVVTLNASQKIVISNSCPKISDLDISAPVSAKTFDAVSFDVNGFDKCMGLNESDLIWNFGDGSPSVSSIGSHATYAFNLPGTYNIMLTVNSNNSSTNSFTRTRQIIINPSGDYSWIAINSTQCSATGCGQTGTKTVTYSCQDSNTKKNVANVFCDSMGLVQPSPTLSCDSKPCGSCPDPNPAFSNVTSFESKSETKRFSTSSVNFGSTCPNSKTLTCVDGIWKDLTSPATDISNYIYDKCVTTPAQSCTIAWTDGGDKIIEHNFNVNPAPNPVYTYSQTWVSQISDCVNYRKTLICNNGLFTSDSKFASSNYSTCQACPSGQILGIDNQCHFAADSNCKLAFKNSDGTEISKMLTGSYYSVDFSVTDASAASFDCKTNGSIILNNNLNNQSNNNWSYSTSPQVMPGQNLTCSINYSPLKSSSNPSCSATLPYNECIDGQTTTNSCQQISNGTSTKTCSNGFWSSTCNSSCKTIGSIQLIKDISNSNCVCPNGETLDSNCTTCPQNYSKFDSNPNCAPTPFANLDIYYTNSAGVSISSTIQGSVINLIINNFQNIQNNSVSFSCTDQSSNSILKSGTISQQSSYQITMPAGSITCTTTYNAKDGSQKTSSANLILSQCQFGEDPATKCTQCPVDKPYKPTNGSCRTTPTAIINWIVSSTSYGADLAPAPGYNGSAQSNTSLYTQVTGTNIGSGSISCNDSTNKSITLSPDNSTSHAVNLGSQQFFTMGTNTVTCTLSYTNLMGSTQPNIKKTISLSGQPGACGTADSGTYTTDDFNNASASVKCKNGTFNLATAGSSTTSWSWTCVGTSSSLANDPTNSPTCKATYKSLTEPCSVAGVANAKSGTTICTVTNNVKSCPNSCVLKECNPNYHIDSTGNFCQANTCSGTIPSASVATACNVNATVPIDQTKYSTYLNASCPSNPTKCDYSCSPNNIPNSDHSNCILKTNDGSCGINSTDAGPIYTSAPPGTNESLCSNGTATTVLGGTKDTTNTTRWNWSCSGTGATPGTPAKCYANYQYNKTCNTAAIKTGLQPFVIKGTSNTSIGDCVPTDSTSCNPYYHYVAAANSSSVAQCVANQCSGAAPTPVSNVQICNANTTLSGAPFTNNTSYTTVNSCTTSDTKYKCEYSCIRGTIPSVTNGNPTCITPSPCSLTWSDSSAISNSSNSGDTKDIWNKRYSNNCNAEKVNLTCTNGTYSVTSTGSTTLPSIKNSTCSVCSDATKVPSNDGTQCVAPLSPGVCGTIAASASLTSSTPNLCVSPGGSLSGSISGGSTTAAKNTPWSWSCSGGTNTNLTGVGATKTCYADYIATCSDSINHIANGTKTYIRNADGSTNTPVCIPNPTNGCDSTSTLNSSNQCVPDISGTCNTYWTTQTLTSAPVGSTTNPLCTLGTASVTVTGGTSTTANGKAWHWTCAGTGANVNLKTDCYATYQYNQKCQPTNGTDVNSGTRICSINSSNTLGTCDTTAYCTPLTTGCDTHSQYVSATTSSTGKAYCEAYTCAGSVPANSTTTTYAKCTGSDSGLISTSNKTYSKVSSCTSTSPKCSYSQSCISPYVLDSTNAACVSAAPIVAGKCSTTLTSKIGSSAVDQDPSGITNIPLCDKGTASLVTGGTYATDKGKAWHWTCSDSNGANKTDCYSAYKFTNKCKPTNGIDTNSGFSYCTVDPNKTAYTCNEITPVLCIPYAGGCDNYSEYISGSTTTSPVCSTYKCGDNKPTDTSTTSYFVCSGSDTNLTSTAKNKLYSKVTTCGTTKCTYAASCISPAKLDGAGNCVNTPCKLTWSDTNLAVSPDIINGGTISVYPKRYSNTCSTEKATLTCNDGTFGASAPALKNSACGTCPSPNVPSNDGKTCVSCLTTEYFDKITSTCKSIPMSTCTVQFKNSSNSAVVTSLKNGLSFDLSMQVTNALSASWSCTGSLTSSFATGNLDAISSTNNYSKNLTSINMPDSKVKCTISYKDFNLTLKDCAPVTLNLDAACGSSGGQTYQTKPATNLCLPASTPTVSGGSVNGINTAFSWTCPGDGGASKTCNANYKYQVNCTNPANSVETGYKYCSKNASGTETCDTTCTITGCSNSTYTFNGTSCVKPVVNCQPKYLPQFFQCRTEGANGTLPPATSSTSYNSATQCWDQVWFSFSTNASGQVIGDVGSVGKANAGVWTKTPSWSFTAMQVYMKSIPDSSGGLSSITGYVCGSYKSPPFVISTSDFNAHNWLCVDPTTRKVMGAPIYNSTYSNYSCYWQDKTWLTIAAPTDSATSGAVVDWCWAFKAGPISPATVCTP